MRADSEVKSSDINLVMLKYKALRYFGFLSMEFEKVISYTNEEVPYVKIENNNTLHYYLNQKSTIGTAVALTVHMMLHIISLHNDRLGSRDSDLWNISADHVVNSTIRRMSNSMKPGICKLHDKHIFFPNLDPDMSVEEVYQFLEDNSDSGDGSGGKNSKNKTTIESDGKGNLSVNDKGNKMEAKSDLDSNPDPELEKKYEKIKDTAKMMYLTDFDDIKGDEDLGLSRYLERIFKVEIPWDEIFKQSLLYYSKSLESRTWTRKNIYIPHYRLPGYSEDLNSLNTLIVSIDLSGSVSDEDYQKFASVVCDSARYYSRLVIMSHETTIQDYVVLSDTNPNAVFNSIKNFHGGGGTSHKDVFNKIEQLYLDGDYMISSIIFLTDFYSDVEDIYQDYKFIKDITTTWILPTYGRHNKVKEVELADCKTITIPMRMA